MTARPYYTLTVPCCYRCGERAPIVNLDGLDISNGVPDELVDPLDYDGAMTDGWGVREDLIGVGFDPLVCPSCWTWEDTEVAG